MNLFYFSKHSAARFLAAVAVFAMVAGFVPAPAFALVALSCDVGELLENASFEDPVVSNANAYEGGFYEVLTSISSWVSTASFEVWKNIYGGGSAVSDQNLELDVINPTTITQTVTTVPGATYRLSFDFSARVDGSLADNSVEAFADESSVAVASADGTSIVTNTWTTHSGTFVATGSTTDISFADTGTDNGTGSLLDNTSLVCVADPVQGCTDSAADNYDVDAVVDDGSCTYPPVLCTVEIVSDTNAYVVERDSSAVLTYEHPNWTADDDLNAVGASWIWADAEVQAPTTTEIYTFQNKFGFVGNVTSATLYVASDNGHVANLNGGTNHPFGSSYNNLQSYDVFGDINDSGNNTLEVKVTNDGTTGTTYSSNPGGALYKLVIKGEVTSDADCSVPYVDAPETCSDDTQNQDETGVDEGGVCTPEEEDTYRIFGYTWFDDNGNTEWDGFEDEESTTTESTLAGWTVNITNGSTTMSTTTDSEGYYYFDVEAGTWTITEEVEEGFERTTEESIEVTVPEEAKFTLLNSIKNFFIPVAYAAVVGNSGPHNFGNNNVPTTGGGDPEDNIYTYGGSGRGGSTSSGGSSSGGGSTPEVLGESTTAEPLVLGEQVDAVPAGAPNAGAGGTSPSFNFMNTTWSALLTRSRRHG